MDKDIREISIEELDKVTGGNYEGPITYDMIDEKAKLLDWIRDTYGLEDAACAAGGFYWDDEATRIFRERGGAAWGEYVKAHYDPNCGLNR